MKLHSTVRLFHLIRELAELRNWSDQDNGQATSGQAVTRDGYTVSWRQDETGSGAPCVVIVVTKEGEPTEEFELVDLNDA